MKLHERAVLAVRGYRKSEAHLIEVLVEIEKSREFTEQGYSSFFEYCTTGLKLSEAVAYNAIAVARKACEVPELLKHIEAIGISTARKMVSVLTSENSAEWIEKAKRLTTRELEREVARVNPKAAAPDRAKYVTAERLELSFGVSEALLGQFKQIQDQISRSLQRDASMEDTLQALVDFYTEKQKPTRLLKAQFTRTVPKAVKYQVQQRDQGRCQAPGCANTRWVQLHHLTPQEQGGQHTQENPLTLCSHHHRELHAELG